MKNTFLILTLCALLISAGFTSCGVRGNSNNLLLFTGSYSAPDSAGIKVFGFDQTTGEITPVGGVSGVSNPSFIAVDADRRLVYAVGEDSGNASTANVLSYNEDASVMTLEQSVATGGCAPCHIALSPDKSRLFTANYMGGSVSAFALDSSGMIADTACVIQFHGIGTDSIRQSQPHLHQITFMPRTSTLLANDLGLDKIYMIDTPYVGQPVGEISVRPGSGPRHTAYHPGGNFAYTLTEISGEILVFDISGGNMKLVQTIAADTLGAQGSADIHLSPDGQYLYASNRLQGDGIAIFRVDDFSGTLAKAGYQSTGAHPRNFVISPNGKFLLVACRDTDSIEVYERNGHTGLLRYRYAVHHPAPTCLVLAPR